MKKPLLSALLILIVFVTGCKKDLPSPEQSNNTQEISLQDTTTYTLTCFLKEIIKKENSQFLIVDSVTYMSRSDIEKLEKTKENIQLLNNAKETGFYLENNESLLKELELNISTLYIMQTFSINAEGMFNFNERIKPLQFEHLVSNISKGRYAGIPFRITYRENKIIKIEEIYIP